MTRYEFLKSLGFTGASLMAALTSCVREEDTVIDAPRISTTASTTTPTVPVTPISGTSDIDKITNYLLKIDISATSTSALKKVGGYVIQNNIVVAQVSAGAFAAVTNLCSHEPKRKVIYSPNPTNSTPEFYCTDHGARFDITGKGLNSNGSKGITAYKVATDGKVVVVYA
jgi:nitrite reductase/ring-hydroxylating ferredoxin subunit